MSRVPVGRRDELDRLTAALDDDHPIAVVGEAGVGKTTLLRAATSSVDRKVFEGGALSTLDWLDYLALDRALGRPMVDGDPTAIATDVEAAVGSAVLILDDLQWAAPATLDVAAQLAGRVAVLAGVRSGEPGTDRAVGQLHAAGYEIVELSGLSGAESGELLDQLRPDLATAGRDRLLHRAGGNPLLLRELATTGEPSASFRLALQARLRRLDAVGREAFELLALAGRPVRASALGDAAVKSLLDAELAVRRDQRVEVRHALLAEVAAQLIDADTARELHARIAAAVDDDGEAARHHMLAGEHTAAFAAAMRAVAATTRPGEQARHLGVAASCADGPEADALKLRAARALEIAHDWEEMVRVLDGIDAHNTQACADAYLLRARGAYSAGDVEGLRTSLAAGLALVDGSGTEIETRLRIEQSRVAILVDYDADAALPAARAGLELAQRQHVDVPRAHYLLGTALAIFAEPGGEDHLLAAIASARAAGETSTEFLAMVNLVSTYEMQGPTEAGRALCDEYIVRARELGLGEWERLIRVARISLDYHAGQYERTIEEAEQLLAQKLDKRGIGQLVELFCVALVDTGRVDEALRRLDAFAPSLTGDARGQFEALYIRMEAAFWGGRPTEALALAEDYMHVSDQDANRFFGAPVHAWSSFDLDRAPEQPPDVDDVPILQPIPIEVAAVAALQRGDADELARSVALFDEAADGYAPLHLRGELRCRWGAGEALRRIDRAAGVRRLEEVELRAQSLGMLPLLARVHRSLRAGGQRRSAPRTRSVGSSLTGRQRELLALVAAGLTNAQIAQRLGISRHTVVTQLASASAKLGATSRLHAATLATASTSTNA